MSKGNGSGTVLKRCTCAPKAGSDAAKLRAWRKCGHNWALRYYSGGRLAWETFKSEAAAKARQAEVYRAKLTGEDRAALDRKRAEMPFCEWADTWIASPGRNDRTRVTYRAALRIIKAAVGNASVRQVADDRQAAKRLLEGRTDTYGAKLRNVMTGSLNAAIDDGMIRSHSLTRMRVEVSTRAKEWTETTPEQRAALADLMGEYRLAVWCGYYLGLRIGESLALRLSDFSEMVSSDGRMIVLNLTRQRQVHSRQDMAHPDDYLKGKSADKSRRQIPVPPELWETVKDAPVYDGDALFPMSYNATVQQRRVKALRARGLPQELVFHSLRHQYVSDLQAAGVSNTQISKLVGHSSTTITDRIYGHQTTEGLAAVLRARKAPVTGDSRGRAVS